MRGRTRVTTFTSNAARFGLIDRSVEPQEANGTSSGHARNAFRTHRDPAGAGLHHAGEEVTLETDLGRYLVALVQDVALKSPEPTGE